LTGQVDFEYQMIASDDYRLLARRLIMLSSLSINIDGLGDLKDVLEFAN